MDHKTDIKKIGNIFIMNKYLTLPDEIIQLIKQYAMATVPFKNELLKREKKKYYWDSITIDFDDIWVYELDYKRFNYNLGSDMAFAWGTENGQIYTEDLYGYKNGNAQELCITGLWDYVKHNTLGLLMQQEHQRGQIDSQYVCTYRLKKSNRGYDKRKKRRDDKRKDRKNVYKKK